MHALAFDHPVRGGSDSATLIDERSDPARCSSGTLAGISSRITRSADRRRNRSGRPPRRGPWRSPDEFIRHSIKAADALLDLQAAIAEGDAQLARGESIDGEEFLDQIEAELEQQATRDKER